MEKCFLLFLILAPGVWSDSILPTGNERTLEGKEKDQVTLSCTYNTESDYVYLFWYRQFPNKEPEYLLRKGARSWSTYHMPNPRFQATSSQTSIELIIKSLELEDSALYYCAFLVGAQ
ncbi:hypothetical protein DNTS_029942 [Danionella cerebrum]|uniref:Ig-like domain-containing protein n=1 Tax=Danionella cerebrum TaxID=2873325 RepID=A0A553RQ04_9TELE|nr:hypothetical protein DNTS_029942 [Danionella translucida]